jgi:hypothetical protein
MTPWKHAVSTVRKWGGSPSDYVAIHDWFDETKSFTGDWTHRALRHHSAGVQWCVLANGTWSVMKVVVKRLLWRLTTRRTDLTIKI